MDELRELLLSMHRGDEDAAVRLCAQVGPRLTAYLRTVDARLADDAVQQTLLRVLALPRARVEGARDVIALLFKIARREAMMMARARGRAERRERAVSHESRASGEMLGEGVPVARWVEALPDEQREVVYLRHVGGLSLDQCSVVLEVDKSVVASRYRSAVTRLRAMMLADQETTA